MMTKLLIFPVTLACLSGCKPKPVEVTLTADELLKALGGELFEVTTPRSINPSAIGGLAIRHADGRIEPSGGISSWKPDTLYKVILLRSDPSGLKAVIFNETLRMEMNFSSIPGNATCLYNPKRTGIGEGEWLFRFSQDNSVTSGDKATDDDCDVIFQIGR